MYPLTSPDDHIPVKPTLSIETKETIDESDSIIDDIDGLNSECCSKISTKTVALTVCTN